MIRPHGESEAIMGKIQRILSSEWGLDGKIDAVDVTMETLTLDVAFGNGRSVEVQAEYEVGDRNDPTSWKIKIVR